MRGAITGGHCPTPSLISQQAANTSSPLSTARARSGAACRLLGGLALRCAVLDTVVVEAALPRRNSCPTLPYPTLPYLPLFLFQTLRPSESRTTVSRHIGRRSLGLRSSGLTCKPRSHGTPRFLPSRAVLFGRARFSLFSLVDKVLQQAMHHRTMFSSGG